jgi:hypothetical protein
MKPRNNDLDSGKWILSSEAKLRALMIWPNKVYYSVDGTKFLILLQRSPTNGFSFCVNNLQVFKHEAQNVTVRLIEVDGTYIDQLQLDELIGEFDGETPLPSKFNGWGDFFWLTEDFEISRPGTQIPKPPIGGSAIEYLIGRRR